MFVEVETSSLNFVNIMAENTPNCMKLKPEIGRYQERQKVLKRKGPG